MLSQSMRSMKVERTTLAEQVRTESSANELRTKIICNFTLQRPSYVSVESFERLKEVYHAHCPAGKSCRANDTLTSSGVRQSLSGQHSSNDAIYAISATAAAGSSNDQQSIGTKPKDGLLSNHIRSLFRTPSFPLVQTSPAIRQSPTIIEASDAAKVEQNQAEFVEPNRETRRRDKHKTSSMSIEDAAQTWQPASKLPKLKKTTFDENQSIVLSSPDSAKSNGLRRSSACRVPPILKRLPMIRRQTRVCL